jgi:hypothetical protein
MTWRRCAAVTYAAVSLDEESVEGHPSGKNLSNDKFNSGDSVTWRREYLKSKRRCERGKGEEDGGERWVRHGVGDEESTEMPGRKEEEERQRKKRAVG